MHADYYFNSVTGEAHWERPPHLVGPVRDCAADPEDQTATDDGGAPPEDGQKVDANPSASLQEPAATPAAAPGPPGQPPLDEQHGWKGLEEGHFCGTFQTSSGPRS